MKKVIVLIGMFFTLSVIGQNKSNLEIKNIPVYFGKDDQPYNNFQSLQIVLWLGWSRDKIVSDGYIKPFGIFWQYAIWGY